MSAAESLYDDFEDVIIDAERIRWPSPAWRGRHVEFARDVLGIRTLAKHQIEILNAYYAPGRIEIAVCTGQKMGKTAVLEIVMCFDWATEPNLNGYLFGPTDKWIDSAVWPRFVPTILSAYYPCRDCMPAHRAWCALVDSDPFDATPRPERCSRCSPLIPSELKDPKNPSKGRRSDWLNETKSESGLRDVSHGRKITGYASIPSKEGSQGGFSGNVRFYVDESSDVSDKTRETCRGNMTGGGKFIAFGNLLYVTGWFYRTFNRDKKDYSRVIQMSSRHSPNCRGQITWSDGVVTTNDNAGRPIKGMATPEDIEANLRAWKNNPNYVCARIDAKPPAIIEGQLADMGRVAQAEKRWSLAECEAATGVLQIGVDVARARDKLAIAVRRGKIILDLHAEVMGKEDHADGVALVLDFVRKHQKPHERKPRIVFDASGPEGAAFRAELKTQGAEDECDIYGVQMGFPPAHHRELYDKRRDELALGFAEWLKAGAIPVNADLEAQIEATTSTRVEVSYGSSGRKWQVHRVITNDDIRKFLDGRSPDERNACELAVARIGDDQDEHEQMAPEATPTRPDAPQAKRSAIPANDTEEAPTLSHYERYAAAYGRHP